MKYGPSRGELKFRLAASGAGLVLMLFIAVTRWDQLWGTIAIFEVVILSSLFFGGTILHSLWWLNRRDK